MLLALVPLLTLLSTADAEPIARAGRAFLAYPGESIRLNGSTSAGTDLHYRWVQIGGPRVPLTGADTARPSFYADLPGRYTFELTVREGDAASAPDEVDVAVLDPEIGTRYAPQSGCSVSASASRGSLALWLAPMLVLGLRRPRTPGTP